MPGVSTAEKYILSKEKMIAVFIVSMEILRALKNR